MRRRRLLVLVLPLVAACVAAPPRREPQIGVEVPEQWTGAPAPAGEQETQWWKSFGDPRLDSLVEQALTYNPDLRAAVASVEAAIAEARIAGADLKPSVGVGLDASRRRQNFIGFPLPGGGVLSTTSTALSLSAIVTWEVDLWGRIRAGAQAALADAQATEADYYAARLSLAALTAKGWFAVVEALGQEELAATTAESFRTTAEQVRSRYEIGVRSPLDLRLALNQLAEAEALLELRRAQRDVATRQLEVLIGSYPEGTLVPETALLDTPPPIPAGLPADLVSRRPDLIAAERRLAAADARYRQARRSLYPRLSLTAGGGTASTDLEDLVNGDFRVWSLVANLVAPLFQGGRLRAGVDLAAAGQQFELALYASQALQAFAEVETALSAEEYLAERERHLTTAARQSKAAERLALQRYRAGLEDYVTVLQSQNSAFAADSQLLTVRRLRLNNRVDLHLALGGGFQMTQIGLEESEDPQSVDEEAAS